VTDADRINALANEAMESIATDDAEDYAHARCAIEIVIEKAIVALTAERDALAAQLADATRRAEAAEAAPEGSAAALRAQLGGYTDDELERFLATLVSPAPQSPGGSNAGGES
jgi:hypothetical protein